MGTGIGILMPFVHAPAPVPAMVASVTTSGRHDTLLERRASGHFYVHGAVNGQLVQFVVDTGADSVALTVEDARRIGIPFSESEFSVIGRSASGDLIGKDVTLDSVTIDGKQVSTVRAIICQGLDTSLLGQSYLSRISAVQMNGDYMVLR
jgi:aspartyl protease family protein